MLLTASNPHIEISQALPVSMARPSAQTNPTVTAATPVDKRQASAEAKQMGQLGSEDEYADIITEDDDQVPQCPCFPWSYMP